MVKIGETEDGLWIVSTWVEKMLYYYFEDISLI